MIDTGIWFPRMTHNEKMSRVESLDKETLLKYSYVPFSIAEMAWDYAESVIDMAISIGNPSTKRLSRAIRQLRRSYDIKRQSNSIGCGIDARQYRQREIDNFLSVEDSCGDFFGNMYTSLRLEILNRWPELEEDYILLVTGVYACNIVLESIFKYTDTMGKDVAKQCGFNGIGDILPVELYKLNSLILEYAGDKRMPFKDKESFVNVFVNKLMTIRFNDVSQ